jgi:peptidoglycan/LPS O-acetylase OafA/YrhL
MRGIAIAVVVWFHVWQQCWHGTGFPIGGFEVNLQPIVETGFLGVSLFFFISGFVIGLPFVEAWFRKARPPSLSAFYWHRIIKIVPSYWLVIAVSLAVGLNVSPLPLTRDVGLHMLFIHNSDISARMSINGVLWTLAIEVQFYLIAPLLMWLFLRQPAIVLSAVLSGAIVWRLLSYSDQSALLDFRMDQLPGNLDLFMFGILAAYLFAFVEIRRPQWMERRALWTALALSGTLACLLLVNDCYRVRFDPNGMNLWQMKYRSCLGCAIALMALGSLFAASWWQRILANPLLLSLAAISYNLYLWHDLVTLGAERLRIPPWSTPVRYDDTRWSLIFLIVMPLVSIAVASVVTFGFERPLLRRFKDADPLGALMRALRVPFAKAVARRARR